MRLNIVTPVFNGARFIDETIMSVVSQGGPFTIRYHVQDGGSTDGTLDKLARWQALLGGAFPLLCRGVEFTYASAPDRGMYDAINTGFARCGASDAMAWIDADDRFEANAFATAAHVFARFPGIEWLCGRVCLLDERGAVKYCPVAAPLPRRSIAAGLFDGRSPPHHTFLQQEGMFWRASLWQKAGGVNSAFRLAGDYDLWRRFAQHAELIVVDAVLGSHREHAAQLTADITAYADEAARIRVSRAAAPPHGGRVLGRTAYGTWAFSPRPTAGQRIWALRRWLPKSLSLRHRA